MDNDVTGKLYLEAALPGMGRRLTGDNGYELFREEYFKCKHVIIINYSTVKLILQCDGMKLTKSI